MFCNKNNNHEWTLDSSLQNVKYNNMLCHFLALKYPFLRTLECIGVFHLYKVLLGYLTYNKYVCYFNMYLTISLQLMLCLLKIAGKYWEHYCFGIVETRWQLALLTMNKIVDHEEERKKTYVIMLKIIICIWYLC